MGLPAQRGRPGVLRSQGGRACAGGCAVSNFTAAQAKALFTAVQSYAEQLGIFQGVDLHEPWNPPGNRLFCSINLGTVRPVMSSGLAAVSLQVVLVVRVWSSALQKPLDNIDPEVLSAACSLMGAISGGFTLGGTVRDVELMAMSAQPAYVDFEGKPFRVIEISLPIIVNDAFAEAA